MDFPLSLSLSRIVISFLAALNSEDNKNKNVTALPTIIFSDLDTEHLTSPGDGRVIHVCELEDLTRSELNAPKTKGRIAEESFWKAAKDCKGYKANNQRYESFGVDEILRRTELCLGPTEYHLLLKNCEHWVNKIKYDGEESKQANDFKIGVGVTGALISRTWSPWSPWMYSVRFQ